MKVFKYILDLYINASIHVAIAVFSLIQLTKYALNSSTNTNLDFFIFFGTILGYNFLKYFEVFWKQVFTFKKNYAILLVSLTAIIGMFFCFFQLEKIIQLEFIKIGLLVLIYPFIRKFGLIKMIFVSLCLTLITVYILEINHNYIYLFQRFAIIFCLLIPLEICDFEVDSKTIKTLPKIIGIQNLKVLGYLLLVLFCTLDFLFFKLNLTIDFVIAIVIAISIFFSNENRSKYYTSFWVESVPVFWLCLLTFTK
ncbi:hypothetical protein [Flavobacterium sp.]|uniref:hypothetical protein n=1 Tax=Flavobacterium sp. TaxID=239 RepID=UPI00286C88F1|nr:hypothetical protein [Flavobacterium sp.]